MQRPIEQKHRARLAVFEQHVPLVWQELAGCFVTIEHVVNVTQAVQAGAVETAFVALGDRAREQWLELRRILLQLKTRRQIGARVRLSYRATEVNQSSQRLKTCPLVNRVHIRVIWIEQKLREMHARR